MLGLQMSVRALMAPLFAASMLLATQASAGPMPVGTPCLDGLGLTCFASKDDGIAGPGGNDTEMSVEAALQAALGESFDVMDIGSGLSIGSGASGTWSYAGSEIPAFLTVKASTHYNLIDVRGLTSGSWTTPTGQGLSHATLWKHSAGLIPEPGAAMLFGVGFLLVGRTLRRSGSH